VRGHNHKFLERMENNFDLTTSKEQIRRSLMWMVLVGPCDSIADRAIHLQIFIDPVEDYFGYGWEVGRVGRALLPVTDLPTVSGK